MAITSKATWIWFPGDFEVWLGNRFNNRRTERGAMFPPFWKQDSHWPTVEFSKTITLQETENIRIWVEGEFNLMLDGKLQYGMPGEFTVPAGEHKLNIKVYNQATPPALYIEGKTIVTDASWLATYEDKIWIDENGVAHGSGIYVPAASWAFNHPQDRPSLYRLSREEIIPVNSENGLYDFGKETFGYLIFRGLKGEGMLHIYYGESRKEALDKDFCETLDKVWVSEGQSEVLIKDSKAFRFVYVEIEGALSFKTLTMDYEYAPQDWSKSGTFRCSDEELNRIWQVGAYTMDLTTREFFVDGIKRDRWTWSGDAVQSYLMNYYLRFDNECVKRTIRQLRGKDPVTAHINTIMDYTFYWFKSVYDYYLYTGDVAFVRELYPRMRSLMDYVLERTNADGMVEGKPDDWIFVDWVDFPMHKRGTLCFEQILFCKSLETMQLCASVLRDYPLDNSPQGSLSVDVYTADALHYQSLFEGLYVQLKPTFWNEERGAFMHSLEEGELNPQITKFPNMFAMLYDYLDKDTQQRVMHSVMLHSDVAPITTPYMRFYELEALCKMGMQNEVMSEMKAYWGGMLREGATSFWEKYVPHEKGIQHLTMYGRPYGKSLCHAWGASPVYLLGRYYLGVEPTSPGYTTYTVTPVLGGLEWMEGDVPTPYGLIHVYMDSQQIKVTSPGGQGILVVNTAQGRIEIPLIPGENVHRLTVSCK